MSRIVIPSAALLMLLFAATLTAQPQSPSGIINRYAKVLAIAGEGCTERLTVTDPTIVAPGDLVLVMQMQGATIVLAESGYGVVRSMGGAGTFELARVDAVIGSDVRLERRLAQSFDPAGAVQLVRVPEYTDVTTAGTITGRRWDGAVGGVVALFASGRMTLGGDVSADSLGFRGGLVETDPNSTTIYETAMAAEPDATRYSAKGEGVAGSNVGRRTAGRGAAANAGGGGGNHNSGGGGGAGWGCGGSGGWGFVSERYSGDYKSAHGIGGFGFTSDSLRAVMGGGGGAGHSNNAVASSGAAGGGIVILFARELDGGSYRIGADGGSALVATYDGGGGGGGGGTILIDAASVSSLALSARGGRGGDAGYPALEQVVGPGGGGGGGRIVTTRDVLAGATIDVTPGGAGTEVVRREFYGAIEGCPGATAIIPLPSNAVPAPEESTVSISCGGSIPLGAPEGHTTYRWSPPEGLSCIDCPSPTASPETTTRYQLVVGGPGPCADTLFTTVVVRNDRTLTASIPRNVRLAIGQMRSTSIVVSEALVASRITFSVGWKRGVVLPVRVEPAPALAADGWSLQMSTWTDSTLEGALTRASAARVDSGDVATLTLRGFLSDTTISELPLTLAIDAACPTVVATPGRAEVDSICGLGIRLFEYGISPLKLSPPVPNPARTSTRIVYELPFDAEAEITLIDASGTRRVYFSGPATAGPHEIELDVSELPAGVYTVQLRVGSERVTTTLVVVH
jgi:hypothetical protein